MLGRLSSWPAVAFTLIEVLVTVALMLLLIATSFSALMFLNRSSASLSSQVAAMSVVHGQIEKISALTYNPGSGYFRSSGTNWTTTNGIFLSKSGTNLLVRGILTNVVTPYTVSTPDGGNVTLGHLVTVTGTFYTPYAPTVVSLQTIVNKFSGGQQ